MADTSVYKKIVYYLIFAGMIVIILLVFSTLEGKHLVGDRIGDLQANGNELGVVAQTLRNLADNIIHIVKIILWMVLVFVTVRFINSIIFGSVLKKASHTEIASLSRTIFSVVIYFVAFFIVFQSQYPDVDLRAIFTGSAIIGIVVGLALQDTLGNLFAGIALQADKPFQVGDVIAISNRGTGSVESVSWRGVKIRTFQSKLLVISNSVLGKETIEVAPQNNLNARVLHFSTVYEASPAKTIQIVREVVRLADNVSPKKRPVVRISDLAENGIVWEIKYWPERYTEFNDTDALIRQRIWYAFQREGIKFPYPTRSVRLERPAKHPTKVETITAAAETLAQVPIFTPCSEEEINKLAPSVLRRIFAPGETIVRKGQEGASMFVITRGSVSIEVPDGDTLRVINTLSSNDFFGEMSLLTGEPRTATVIAKEETEVLQIRKPALKPLFEANPELLSSISKIVEKRKLALAEGAEDHSTEALDDRTTGLIRSIRKFFGLRH